MKVSVLRSVRDLVIEERDIPVPGPDQVLVRVRSVGVCGSDVHYFEHGRIGEFVVDRPVVLGHEASGVVEQVGDNVSQVAPGDRVSIEPGVPDFTCPQCRAGRYNLCPNMHFFATPPVDGAFAEYVVAHAEFVHKVPDVISDDAAALIEPLSVAIWACEKANVNVGDTVLVTGAGAIGLLSLQVALARGAKQVYVSDVNDHRLEVARGLGAVTISAGKMPLEDLWPRPDVLIECSGAAPVVKQGVSSLAPAGRAVLVGMGADEVSIPVAAIQGRELSLTGTFRYANTWPSAISLAASGRVNLERLVTGHFGLVQVEEALTAARTDEASIKAMVRPGM